MLLLPLATESLWWGCLAGVQAKVAAVLQGVAQAPAPCTGAAPVVPIKAAGRLPVTALPTVVQSMAAIALGNRHGLALMLAVTTKATPKNSQVNCKCGATSCGET